MQLSILFLLFLIFILKNVGSSSCPESLTTVDQVDGCPRNKEEWEYNAMKKNCSSVSQNCVNSSEFLYHCVINEFVNMTIEVCAPKVTILGRNCAEFNMHGAVIQDTVQGVNATCKDQNPPCPFRYNSTDSYKYQRCYSYIKREDQTIPCNKTVTVKNIRSDKKAWLTVSIVFITFTVCLMCVLGALLIQRYRKRLSNRNEDDEEAMPLIQPTVSITKRENLNWVSSIYIGDKYCCMAYLNPHSPEDIVSVGKVERIGVLITDLVSGEIVEFGDDAREIYIENRDGYQDYIFLDELNVKKENVSEQHPLKTSQIYKQLINYLIRKIWKEMSDANPKEESLCKSCDVNYVITVPHHWKDEIKMLRKAFEEVMVDFHHTIQKDKLHIKLREVAISPYIHEVNDPVTCLNLNVDNMTLRKNKT
ncbi:uncharacterized protein LOC134266984 [Saccostrea cucullata]|uniref:uncharacterized protein LOC134266984 n=1 Tax=Saccostrea cuccullata TaxID=36930 RepID=UPI002ED03BE4